MLDDAGSRSTVIFGAGPGAHVAALFAATMPERIPALVLWDFYAWAGDASTLATSICSAGRGERRRRRRRRWRRSLPR